MPVYYSTHPNLSVTSLVTAPTTEKARTTFLDYLERRGAIARADRSYWRRNMIAERMDNPQDVQADVELYYGYQEGGQTMPPSMAAVPTYSEEERQDVRDEISPTSETVEVPVEEEEKYVVSAEPQQSIQASVEEAPAPRKLSPIQQIALGKSER